ncbi:MAG: Rieske (2Fe-2S) protein [Candidatus Poribacteria bacterium]|nr:Rieske (2Fe-2S) protein [Candidatus Poribacteria bacterium]
MKRYVVAKVEELPPGERKIVPVGGKGGIGVFNVGGTFYALRNMCPHRGGPLCQGRLRPHIISSGTYQTEFERENEIIKCSWHQWEFDIKTGRALYDPRMRVKTYPVTVEADEVILHLDS